MSDHKITVHGHEVDLGDHHGNHELRQFIEKMHSHEIEGLAERAKNGHEAIFTAHVNGDNQKFRLSHDGTIHRAH